MVKSIKEKTINILNNVEYTSSKYKNKEYQIKK